MADKQLPIPADRILPQMHLMEADTVLVMASLTMCRNLLSGEQAAALDAVLKKVEAQRATSHRILRKVMAREQLNATKHEQMPRMVNGTRIVTRRDQHPSRGKHVLHATITDAGHPDELNVRLDDGTHDQWLWSDPMLRIEGEAEYDETA
jgi:hypothetical protein